jgi:general secretion pathway protein J
MAYSSAQLNANAALHVIRTALIATDSGRGSRIDFNSFSHQRLYRDAHESDQNELSYYIDDDPDDKGKRALLRREQRRPDDDPQKGGQVQVLIHDVLKFELSYLDPQTGEWLTTWDTSQAAMQPNRLPSQVRIKVTVPALRGTGPSQTFGTRATLPLQYALNHAIYYPQ